MATLAEEKFKRVVKEIYHNSLKPLGYLKKANNFYLPGEVGKIINLQKSTFYSADYIKFTVNVGVFSPLYWSAYYRPSLAQVLVQLP